MKGNKFPKKHLHSFITQVHALKSASATLGVTDILEKTSRLEEACNAEDLTFILENLDSLIEHLSEVKKNISAALESGKTDDPNFQDSAENYLPLFNELAQALQSRSTRDIDRILDVLNEKPLNFETKEILDKISDQVLMTEFSAAEKTINELINSPAPNVRDAQ
jgi:HPt (histidine-containing phosphotransfer) domain-containing protein